MSRCQRRGTAVRPSLLYEEFASTCDNYTENEDSPWKLPPESAVRMRVSRPAAMDSNLKSRLTRLEERVAQLESSKENLTGTSVEIKSFYTDPNDPSSVIGFVSGADRRFKFTEPISLPEAASFPNVDLKETKVMEAPTSLDAEPVVTPPPPEAPPFDAPPFDAPPSPPLRSPGDLGISSSTRGRTPARVPQPTLQEAIVRRRAGLRKVSERSPRGSRSAARGGISIAEAMLRDTLGGMRAFIRNEESENEEDNDDDEWGVTPPRRSVRR